MVPFLLASTGVAQSLDVDRFCGYITDDSSESIASVFKLLICLDQSLFQPILEWLLSNRADAIIPDIIGAMSDEQWSRAIFLRVCRQSLPLADGNSYAPAASPSRTLLEEELTP